MSNIDKVKDDSEKDYLHPQGKPAVAPQTPEERKNLAKADASTQLVEELSKDSHTDCAKTSGDTKSNAKNLDCEKEDDVTLKLEKVDH